MAGLYDTIIVGAGPAGLNFAMHSAWHGRNVLVLDRGSGPLYFVTEPLMNVPLARGLSGVDILKKMRAEVQASGAKVIVHPQKANVINVAGKLNNFKVTTENGNQYQARSE